MLPGFVSGFYGFDECHVDLMRLAQYAGATLILAPAIGIDLKVCPCMHMSKSCFLFLSSSTQCSPFCIPRL